MEFNVRLYLVSILSTSFFTVVDTPSCGILSLFRLLFQINLTSFLATLFEQSHVYTKESSIAVNSKAYFHRLFTYLDTGVDE